MEPSAPTLHLPANGRSRWPIALVIVWLALLLMGSAALWRHALTPGLAATPASVHWPASSLLPQPHGRVTVVMVVHPYCPCSDASIDELRQILNDHPSIAADVIFTPPPGDATDLSTTSLWKSAATLPRCALINDATGELAREFGANTSGQTLVYDSSGNLQFAGGLTAARGHPGAGSAAQSIASIAGGSRPRVVSAPVYGCSIRGCNTK